MRDYTKDAEIYNFFYLFWFSKSTEDIFEFTIVYFLFQMFLIKIIEHINTF